MVKIIKRGAEFFHKEIYTCQCIEIQIVLNLDILGIDVVKNRNGKQNDFLHCPSTC